MRSRASQARALIRILATQASSAGSTGTISASSSSASSSSSATNAAATVAARSTGSATAFKRRRNVAKAVADKVNDSTHRTIFINSKPSRQASTNQSVISGLKPVQPPVSSLASVATQAFFASDRPLLEHQVIIPSLPSSSSSHLASSQERKAMSKIASTIDNAKEAIMEAASQASRLSPEELSRTTFIVADLSGEIDGEEGMIWPKKISSLNHDRFVQLVDRLSQSNTGRFAVQAEAKALEAEEAERIDVETAVASALERGDDPSIAKSLGSEADLVILGEPSGPNPKWARGVASFLAERTRALEPPESPLMEREEENLANAMERMDIEDLAKHFAGSKNAFTVQNICEEDPNLFFSHAMVQAIVPTQLKWDKVVAKMNAATGNEKGATNQIIDLSRLDASLLAPREVGKDDEVHMDSVKRKRRKKMRKHKYRKFRKATRVERNRLKK